MQDKNPYDVLSHTSTVTKVNEQGDASKLTGIAEYEYLSKFMLPPRDHSETELGITRVYLCPCRLSTWLPD
ncbi:hypothetical protein PTI98_003414 [Pleurotus ostreatus]|nr:hypothetical protein PTI98_003414 [Pleurotus ostreatus]